MNQRYALALGQAIIEPSHLSQDSSTSCLTGRRGQAQNRQERIPSQATRGISSCAPSEHEVAVHMGERELKLAQVVLGIARAKRDRKARRKELKLASASDRENIQNLIQTIEAGIEASKAQRDALIEELLSE